MEIVDRDKLQEAKKELERLIDMHKYDQMLAGGSKIPADPKILWLHKAIEKFEKDNPFEPDYGASYSQGYPSD